MGVKRASKLNLGSNVYSSTPSSGAINCDILVVAGGAGGQSFYNSGPGQYFQGIPGGAGAGGVAYVTNSPIAKGITYVVTVGAGGSSPANLSSSATNGNDSFFGYTVNTNIDFGTRAFGGGCAAAPRTGGFTASPGGSGGGGGYDSQGASYQSGATGVLNQGYAGAAGWYTNGVGGGPGGGGGAGGSPAAASASGGPGISNSITGSSVFYGGGGAASGGSGGSGGGGNSTGAGVSGTQNTGGGGGAAYGQNSSVLCTASGGSGVIIIRVPSNVSLAETTGSPTVTDITGFKIYRFTSSGTIKFN